MCRAQSEESICSAARGAASSAPSDQLRSPFSKKERPMGVRRDSFASAVVFRKYFFCK